MNLLKKYIVFFLWKRLALFEITIYDLKYPVHTALFQNQRELPCQTGLAAGLTPKLSKSKSLYNFWVWAPSIEEVAKSARSRTRNQAKACKVVGDASLEGSLIKSRLVSGSKNIKNVPKISTRNTLENKF